MSDFASPAHAPARPVEHTPILSSDDSCDKRSIEDIIAAADRDDDEIEPLDLS